MGHRCCSKQKVKRGLWSPEEDDKLVKHITAHGHGSWSSVPKLAGLQRCGKSCRLRWINYLRPDLRRGTFTAEEEQIIIDVHRILGNRWAQIAKHLPGRTDNEVKNFWNSCIKKKLLSQGLDPKTHNLLSSRQRASNINKLSSQSQYSSEQPFTISNIRSSTDHTTTPTVMINMNMNPPVLTLPAALPDQPMAMQIPNSESRTHQIDPNKEFPYVSSIDSSTINMSSSSSSSIHHLSEFNYNLLDDQNPCINWDANVIVNETTFEAPRVEGIQQQEREKICDMEINKIVQVDNMDMVDAAPSFDSCSFDLSLLESTLMSSAICRDFNSMDEFSWNF